MAAGDFKKILSKVSSDTPLEEHMHDALLTQMKQVETLRKDQEKKLIKLENEIICFEKVIEEALRTQKEHVKRKRIHEALELKKALREQRRKLSEFKKQQREAARNASKKLESVEKLIESIMRPQGKNKKE